MACIGTLRILGAPAPLNSGVRHRSTFTTMFSKILNMLSPPPLSDKWLSINATPYSRANFESDTKQSRALPIYHVSDHESGQSIYATGKIFGIGVVSSAHFHHTPQGANRQPAADGILLGFTWRGAVANVDLSNDASSHRDCRPNILFDVPILEYNNQTWELRLHPGTAGLLPGFLEISNTCYLLRSPRDI